MQMSRLISEALIRGDKTTVTEQVKVACSSGENALQILEEGLLAGMDIIGQRFKKGEIFIPEVLASAGAMHAGLNMLKPLLIGQGVKPIGKVLIATVAGDVHDIGKNIVAMMLEAGQFEVVDLGVNVTVERVVESVRSEKPDVLALSALLSTTMPMFKKTIEVVKDAGLTVKTIVGGAAVTLSYAKESGADAYAPNAVMAVDVVKKLVI